MYLTIRNKLKFQTTYGELIKLYYNEYHISKKKFEKYDIHKEIENLDIQIVSQYLVDKAKKIKQLQKNQLVSMVDKPPEITTDDIKILFSHKTGYDNFTSHIEMLSFLNLKKSSFATQKRLEDEMLNGTYNVKECVEFLTDMIDKNTPYIRTLKFLLILLITDKIENTKLFSLKKINKEIIEYIKKGFIQNYGYQELITLTNLQKIIQNINKWQNELENNDFIQIITEWKTRKPEKFVIPLKAISGSPVIPLKAISGSPVIPLKAISGSPVIPKNLASLELYATIL